MFKNTIITLVLILVLPSLVNAQRDSVSFFAPSQVYNKTRFTTLVVTEATLYGGSMIGLNSLWYKDYPRSSFHFFDDNAEWQQMDKVGHMTTSFAIGKAGIDLLKWSGVERKKAIWYGGALGSVYQSTIEILDGFSSQWGFSWGDFSANTVGSVLLIGQELAWDEVRIVPKFSFHQSVYPQYRPNMLGSNLAEQILKDYNGQTYWLSFNISSFLHEDNRFPAWLDLSLGYGAEGMTGAVFNPPFDKNGYYLPVFDRYRKFYVSLDADLTRIKTRSHFLKTVFNTIGFIKIPAPAIGFSEKGVSTYLFYF